MRTFFIISTQRSLVEWIFFAIFVPINMTKTGLI